MSFTADDDDLENLRLAALQTLHHKKPKQQPERNVPFPTSQTSSSSVPSLMQQQQPTAPPLRIVSSGPPPQFGGYNYPPVAPFNNNNQSTNPMRVNEPFLMNPNQRPGLNWSGGEFRSPSNREIQLSPRSAAFVEENNSILMRRKVESSPDRWSPEPRPLNDRRWSGSRTPSPVKSPVNRTHLSPISPGPMQIIRSPLNQNNNSPRIQSRSPPANNFRFNREQKNHRSHSNFDNNSLKPSFPRRQFPRKSPAKRQSKSPLNPYPNNHRRRSRERRPERSPERSYNNKRQFERNERRKRTRSRSKESEVSKTQKIEDDPKSKSPSKDEIKPLKEESTDKWEEKSKKEEDKSSSSESESSSSEDESSKSDDGIDLFASEESESENEGRFKTASSKPSKRDEVKPPTVSFSKLGSTLQNVELKELEQSNRDQDPDRHNRDRFRRNDRNNRRRDDHRRQDRDRRDDKRRSDDRSSRSNRDKSRRDRDQSDRRNGKPTTVEKSEPPVSKFKSTFQSVDPVEDAASKKEKETLREDKREIKRTINSAVKDTAKDTTSGNGGAVAKEEPKKVSVRMRLGGYVNEEDKTGTTGAAAPTVAVKREAGVISIVRKRPFSDGKTSNARDKEAAEEEGDAQKVTKWKQKKSWRSSEKV